LRLIPHDRRPAGRTLTDRGPCELDDLELADGRDDDAVTAEFLRLQDSLLVEILQLLGLDGDGEDGPALGEGDDIVVAGNFLVGEIDTHAFLGFQFFRGLHSQRVVGAEGVDGIDSVRAGCGNAKQCERSDDEFLHVL
jgi:hypothetical protein